MTSKEHQYSDEEIEGNYDQYIESRNKLHERQFSNSQLFDKAILALSSAGLGFSLAFIRKGVSIAETTQVYLLYASWLLFFLAIAFTLVSFFTSNSAIKKQLKSDEAYYFENKSDDSKDLGRKTELLTLFSMLFYLFAIVCVILFTILNPNTNHTLNEVLR